MISLISVARVLTSAYLFITVLSTVLIDLKQNGPEGAAIESDVKDSIVRNQIDALMEE